MTPRHPRRPCVGSLRSQTLGPRQLRRRPPMTTYSIHNQPQWCGDPEVSSSLAVRRASAHPSRRLQARGRSLWPRWLRLSYTGEHATLKLGEVRREGVKAEAGDGEGGATETGGAERVWLTNATVDSEGGGRRAAGSGPRGVTDDDSNPSSVRSESTRLAAREDSIVFGLAVYGGGGGASRDTFRLKVFSSSVKRRLRSLSLDSCALPPLPPPLPPKPRGGGTALAVFAIGTLASMTMMDCTGIGGGSAALRTLHTHAAHMHISMNTTKMPTRAAIPPPRCISTRKSMSPGLRAGGGDGGIGGKGSLMYALAVPRKACSSTKQEGGTLVCSSWLQPSNAEDSITTRLLGLPKVTVRSCDGVGDELG
eukprot:scaffold9343_cov110-Isochrysis_galbana.AAC.2